MEKDLKVLVEENLYMAWQCGLTAQKPSHVLSYSKSCLANRVREVILPFYSALMRSPLECCTQL